MQARADACVRIYDAFLLPALSVPTHEHGLTRFTISGQMVPTSHIQTAAIPVNLTGLPTLAMRFVSGSECLPVGVRRTANWHAEFTILHLATLLESISPVRDQHSAI
ncbi:hypothetical protein ABZS88_26270 [Streptomyces sp. NPDC005480]|uniref:hypothetical protein n=1 Tax=Streptomyces sp. NPDC005480 TaxID=3154880 RepID=UPI0033A1FC5B